VGSWSSLALDAGDMPHISYHNEDNGSLMYTYLKAGEWNREIVDAVGNAGTFNSLALDADERAHMAYYNQGSMNLEYAFQGDSGWEITSVHSDYPDFFCGTRPSLALDSAGNPHIAYLVRYRWSFMWTSVWFASKDAQGWDTSCLEDGFAGDVLGLSLALTNNDIPHIAFDGHAIDDRWRRILFFLHKPAESWITESVPGSGGSWGAVSIAVDSAERPHIAYHKWMYEGLHYAYMAPGSVELSIEENEGSVVLSWAPYSGAALYEIHGTENDPYFFLGPEPGSAYLIATVPSSHNSWETTNGVGDPDENWAFLIIAIDETDTELARSNRVGEHDFLWDYPE
jgi:hypothetical protein